VLIGVRLWAGAAVSKLCRNWGLQALANGAQADPRGQDPQGQAMKEAALGMATYQLFQLRQTVESKVDIGVDIIRAYRRFPWSWPELDYYFWTMSPRILPHALHTLYSPYEIVLLRVHICRMLTRAGNPMLCPIHVFRNHLLLSCIAAVQ